MDNDTYVYCVKCSNLKVGTKDEEYPLSCKYEGECNFFDPEDGRRFSERPHYELSENPGSWDNE